MGGRQCTRRGRQGRPRLRRAVLLAAFGLLAGVTVLLCGAPPAEHAVPDRAAPHGLAVHGLAAHGATAHGVARAVCVSPYDLPGCAPFPEPTPGVLPVPPPPVTLAGGDPPPAAAGVGAGRRRPPEPLARAPDLHALQVLRT